MIHSKYNISIRNPSTHIHLWAVYKTIGSYKEGLYFDLIMLFYVIFEP